MQTGSTSVIDSVRQVLRVHSLQGLAQQLNDPGLKRGLRPSRKRASHYAGNTPSK